MYVIYNSEEHYKKGKGGVGGLAKSAPISYFIF
jgi:hypothetical protein